jgi:DNA-binding CsgD family transcriptional regulator
MTTPTSASQLVFHGGLDLSRSTVGPQIGVWIARYLQLAGLDSKAGGATGTRQLRALLARLRGCFYALPRRERRVLVLRAGLNGRRPHSRAEIARRLRMSPKNVGRVERRALRRLRRTARTDGCGSVTGGGRSGAATTGEVLPAIASVRLPIDALQITGSPFATRGSTPDRIGLRGEFNAPLGPVSRDGGVVATMATWAIGALLLLALLEVLGLLGLRRHS